MAEPIFTVIGACTSTSAKIFAVFDGNSPLQAELSFQCEDSDLRQTVRVQLRQAPPFLVYSFELHDLPASTNGTRIQYSVNGSAYRSFRLLPSGRPLRIALISCNDAVEVLNKKRRHILWTELKENIDAGNVDLLIHAGDQVYADGIRLRYRVRDHVLNPLDESYIETIAGKYRKLYVDTWRVPQVADVLSICPSIFMWDDHDIYDGYGSDEDDFEPVSQILFQAAKKAFQEFQQIHNPAPLGSGSFSFAMLHEGTGILVLDERTNRSWGDRRVLGNAEFVAVEKWLQQQQSTSLTDLYLISPTPLLYVPVAAYLKLIQMIGWKGPLTEDLRDCWTAPNNQAECLRLLKMLFDFSKQSPETRIHILSGDVHVAAYGKIQKASRVIRQVISSGIGSLPPRGISGMVLKAITEEKVELTGTGFRGILSKFPGTDNYILAKRNFAIVTAQSNGLDVNYFAEDDGKIVRIPCKL